MLRERDKAVWVGRKGGPAGPRARREGGGREGDEIVAGRTNT